MKRIFLLFLVLFSISAYFYFSRSSETLKMSNIDWKNANLKELPFPAEKLDKEIRGISVTEHTTSVQDYDVFYKKASCADSKCINVLFLHGMRFKSETWLNLKTIHYVAALGFDVTAIDFPGYGESSSSEQVPEKERATFLHELITALKLAPCVIICPSLSGSFTIPLLKSHPEDFFAFIPIAPISTSSLSTEEYKTVTIPTLVLCGEKDDTIGREAIDNLKHIPTSQVVVMKKAGHAAYLDDPATFHQVLFNFLTLVSKLPKKVA